MHLLSKSKILAFRQCHKRLWLEVHHPELRHYSATTEIGFSVGEKVGKHAHTIYDPHQQGTCIAIDPRNLQAAFAQTLTQLAGNAPIFEAGFHADGALNAIAFADVLLPVYSGDKKIWRIVEVKASTAIKPYHRDDVAIQATIAHCAGLELASIAVAHIDNQWVYQGDGNYTGLLKEIDLTAESFARADEIKQWIITAQEIVNCNQAPDIATGKQCNTPYPCAFINHCHATSPAPSTPSAPSTEADENRIIEKPIFDINNAAKALAKYPLPALFLDFETVQFAIPRWKGWRAYQKIPFQFSVHYIDKDHQVSHAEFLDISGNDPTENFAKALIEACAKSGFIFVYSSFEKTRIHELAERFPAMSDDLLALNQRIVDLLPITKKFYHPPNHHKSKSLKAVLPAVYPDISYDKLNGIRDGGMAMQGYQEAIRPDISDERKESIRQQLLNYCQFDTWALLKLWQFFTGNHIA